jgi:transposase-like protein
LYTTLLTDATLYEALIAIDQDLAVTAQAGGCRQCPGRLHHGDYPRKPRGGPSTLPAAYDRRTSYCCARCRKRLTPPSVRFLGRRVYLAVVVVLACVLRQGPTPTRVRRLREVLGVSAETLTRWHRWWREAFVRTPFWRAARARLAAPVDEADLPQALLARFPGEASASLVAMLRFLSPLTTASTVGEG